MVPSLLPQTLRAVPQLLALPATWIGLPLLFALEWAATVSVGNAVVGWTLFVLRPLVFVALQVAWLRRLVLGETGFVPLRALALSLVPVHVMMLAVWAMTYVAMILFATLFGGGLFQFVPRAVLSGTGVLWLSGALFVLATLLFLLVWTLAATLFTAAAVDVWPDRARLFTGIAGRMLVWGLFVAAVWGLHLLQVSPEGPLAGIGGLPRPLVEVPLNLLTVALIAAFFGAVRSGSPPSRG